MSLLHGLIICICALIDHCAISVHASSFSSLPSSSYFSSSVAISDLILRKLNARTEDKLIPGLVSEDCAGLNHHTPPCIAICRKHDSACMIAASSVSSTCAPQWDSYISTLDGSSLPSKGAWSWVTKVQTSGAGIYTTTWSEYTTFSTVHGYSVIGYGGTTITPVYALGTPITHTSVYTSMGWSQSWITAPPPSCRYHAVSWLTSDTCVPPSTTTAFTTSCGECTIYGGTVELLWWPELSTVSVATNESGMSTVDHPRSIVINGSTLVSPTVYISLHAVSASDYCSPVGKTFSSTLLAMNPTDVSTLVHFGGKAAATGANWYGPLNYSHLTVKPTLVVPTQIRSLDPAWADCAGALQGLYDPPIALDSHQTQAGSIPSYAPALPYNTASLDRAKETWTVAPSTLQPLEMQRQSLAGILGSMISDSQSHHDSVLTTVAKQSISAGGTTAPPSRTLRLSPGFNESPTLSITKPSEETTAQASGGVRTMSRSGFIETLSSTNAREADRSTQYSTTGAQLQISVNSEKQYIVNGQTFAPSSPITLPGKDGPTTYRPLTSNSRTYVAMGSSTTILLAGVKDKATSGANDADLEFTRASNGNFVLHGTTLVSGVPITIGIGSSRTTLRVTTVNSTPAVVLDGSITEFLGHNTSSVDSMSKFSAPAETKAPSVTVPPKTTADGVGSVSSEARSSAQRHELLRLKVVLLPVLFVLLL